MLQLILKPLYLQQNATFAKVTKNDKAQQFNQTEELNPDETLTSPSVSTSLESILTPFEKIRVNPPPNIVLDKIKSRMGKLTDEISISDMQLAIETQIIMPPVEHLFCEALDENDVLRALAGSYFSKRVSFAEEPERISTSIDFSKWNIDSDDSLGLTSPSTSLELFPKPLEKRMSFSGNDLLGKIKSRMNKPIDEVNNSDLQLAIEKQNTRRSLELVSGAQDEENILRAFTCMY